MGEGAKQAQVETGGRMIAGILSREVIVKPLEQSDYKIELQNAQVKAWHDMQLPQFIYMLDKKRGIGVSLTAHAPHWRTVAVLGDTQYLDRNGKTQYYFTISTKGAGFTRGELVDEGFDTLATREEGAQINLGHSWKYEYYTSEGDLVSFTEKLTKLGVRSELYWGVAKVNKVSFKGELVDVKEAREKGLIHKNRELHPYVGVRLLRTNHRIEDLFASTDPGKKQAMIEEVLELFNRETHLTKRDLPEIHRGNADEERIYANTTIAQYVKNLSIVISNGMTYYHMHSSNLTLLGELADTGHIEHIYNNADPLRVRCYKGVRAGYLKDMRDCIMGVRRFLKALKKEGIGISDNREVYGLCIREFTGNFDIDLYRKQDKKANPEALNECFAEITRRMLVDQENLKSVKHGSIEEWQLESLR